MKKLAVLVTFSVTTRIITEVPDDQPFHMDHVSDEDLERAFKKAAEKIDTELGPGECLEGMEEDTVMPYNRDSDMEEWLDRCGYYCMDGSKKIYRKRIRDGLYQFYRPMILTPTEVGEWSSVLIDVAEYSDDRKRHVLREKTRIQEDDIERMIGPNRAEHDNMIMAMILCLHS